MPLAQANGKAAKSFAHDRPAARCSDCRAWVWHLFPLPPCKCGASACLPGHSALCTSRADCRRAPSKAQCGAVAGLGQARMLGSQGMLRPVSGPGNHLSRYRLSQCRFGRYGIGRPPRAEVDAVMMSRVSVSPMRRQAACARVRTGGSRLTRMPRTERITPALGNERIIIAAYHLEPQPSGNRTLPTIGLAIRLSPRLASAIAGGIFAFTLAPTGAMPRARHDRAHPKFRAPSGDHGPRGPVPGARGWRYHYDNAHVDRCAPPGRNPGGGAQRQPHRGI